MKKIIAIVLPLILLASCSSKKTETENEKKAKALVSQMTLKEKVGQMTQVTIDPILKNGTDQLDMDKLRDVVVNYGASSILNVPFGKAQTAEWFNHFVSEIQKVATTETRLGIPIIYALDQVHGGTYTLGSTLFPQQITLAASWEPVHARRMAEITAYEMRAANVCWNFSPILDLGSDPRFSRQYEGFGEDPYLGSVFGHEVIKGNEGDDNDISNPLKVAACMKHFLGYGVPFNGKDRTPAYIPRNALLEYHVPAFKAAIDAGVHTVMINSGIINNEPVHASFDIVTDLLRNQLGFDGMIVTDWEDIDKLHTRDKLAATSKEAVKIGINAGIDMVMVPLDYRTFSKNLMELVEEGEVPMSRIDDAVTRIIKLKYDLGLFETPNTFKQDYPEYASCESAKASYDAAADAITLLKNENNILPLKKNAKILLTGPGANSRRALVGGWTVTWQGHGIEEYPELCPTILEIFQQEFGKENVIFVPGVSYNNTTRLYKTEHKDRFDEAIAKAKNVDYVVMCLGESSYCEKPGDLDDLYLNELQTELALEMLKTGKKTIVVLAEGRPRVISKFSSKVDAILQSYLPGTHGAQAIADVMLGKVNPSGKLPYTYPAFPNSLVPYYHKYAEEQKKSPGVYNYEGDYNPEYHFGYGLSYTTFEYTNAKINKPTLKADSKETIVISVDVTNTGNREGKEVVQLYSSDLYASLIPDTKRLRRFEKINLKPGETKIVVFELTLNDLAFYNLQNKRIVEPGDFEFLIGASSNDIKYKLEFEILN